MPDPTRKLMLMAEVIGSGKFGTPCERMQSEYSIPFDARADAEFDAEVMDVLDDPQPASTSAPNTTAIAP